MLHFTRLDPKKEHYFIRHFEDTPENPLGPIDPVTGQPWKKYDGTALLTIDGDRAEIIGLLRIPDGAYYELKDKLIRELNLKKMIGERWINQRKISKEIPLR